MVDTIADNVKAVPARTGIHVTGARFESAGRRSARRKLEGLMRIALASLAMLLALPGPAATAQDVQESRLQCAGVTAAASALHRLLSEVNIGSRDQLRGIRALREDIEGQLPDMEAVPTALFVSVWESYECAVAYEELEAAVLAEGRRHLAPFAGAEGDLSILNDRWDDLRPQLACHTVLTEAELSRARQIIETQTGYPCGWSP